MKYKPALVDRPCIGSSRRPFIAVSSYRYSRNRNERRTTPNDDGFSLLDNVEPDPSPSVNQDEDRVSRLRKRREERRIRMREQALAGNNGNTFEPTNQRLVDNASEFYENDPATAQEWNESEWGPAPLYPPEYNEYGWAEDSWADSSRNNAQGNRRKRRSRKEWEESFEQRGDDEENTLQDSYTNETYINNKTQRSATMNREDAPKSPNNNNNKNRVGDRDDAYGNDEDGTARSSAYQPGFGEPDIALLSQQELDRVLPVVPFSAQASYFNGGAAQAVQRWSASLALTVLLSKVAVLAAGTLTWPIWWPWAQATSKNYALRKQSGYAGLWRTQIIDVETRGRPRPQFTSFENESRKSSSQLPPRFSTMRTVRIVLGDPDGAQTQFILPQDARYELLQPGQPAELIVLSDSPNFESFKAVKDVYLPESGLWLSEYPYVDRTEFLELSLEVEREAMAAQEEGELTDDDYEYFENEDRYRDRY